MKQTVLNELVKDFLKTLFSRSQISKIQKSIYRISIQGKEIEILSGSIDKLKECEKSNKLAYISLKNWELLPSPVREKFKDTLSNLIKLDFIYLSIDELFKNDYSLFKSMNPDLIVFVVFEDNFELVVTDSTLIGIKGIISNRFKGKGNFNYKKIVARYQIIDGCLNVFKL